MFKNQRKNNRGFSLIEVMVSLAVFAIVVLVAAGALLKVIDANKKSQALKAVINNLNFALESMSRELRTGATYHCEASSNITPSGAVATPKDCPGGGVYLAFEEQLGTASHLDQHVYRFQNGTIQKSINSGMSYDSIIGSDVVIENLKFYVTGTALGSTGDTEPAKVLIVLNGYVNTRQKFRSDFSLQTTISQRNRE